MKFRLMFACCIMFIAKLLYSQSAITIDQQKILQQLNLVEEDDDVLQKFSHNFLKSIIVQNDSIIYYNPNGTLHLYKIQLGENTIVEKLSNGKHHGHNFKRLLFMHDDIVYSYGGTGLFNINTSLIFFDIVYKEWYKKDIKNYPFDSRHIINSWVIGDTLAVLLNHWSEYAEESSNKYNKYSFGYIDLKDFEYNHQFTFNNESESDLGVAKSDYIFHFKEYTLFGYREDSLFHFSILNKNTGELSRTPFLTKVAYVGGKSSLYVKNNLMYFKNQNVIDSVNLDSITLDAERNFIQIYQSKSSKSGLNSLSVIIGITSIVLLVIFLFNRRKSDKKLEHKEFILEIEKRLTKLKGETITKEKLENQLELINGSYDTIKTNRSIYIRLLNERGLVKIERVRKKDDKRYFDYKIS